MNDVCTIVAGGPSIKGYKGPLHGYVIAVNWAWKSFPNYDLLVAWDRMPEGFPDHETRADKGGNWLPKGPFLNKTEGQVVNRNASVCFAVNIGYHKGFRKFYLLGCDGRVTDTPHHYHRDEDFDQRVMNLMKTRMPSINKHIEVTCDHQDIEVWAIDSALDLPSMTLKEYENVGA